MKSYADVKEIIIFFFVFFRITKSETFAMQMKMIIIYDFDISKMRHKTRLVIWWKLKKKRKRKKGDNCKNMFIVLALMTILVCLSGLESLSFNSNSNSFTCFAVSFLGFLVFCELPIANYLFDLKITYHFYNVTNCT